MKPPSSRSPWPMLLGTSLAATVGCYSGPRPVDLDQAWQLDRLRVLGVKAEPAEPRPGDVVTFESFTYVPDGIELEGIVWFGCLPTEADDFGCTIDQSAFEQLFEGDIDDLSPEELAELYEAAVEAGLIGFEPLIAPSWVAPAEALDGLEGDARLEGRSAIVNITAIPTDAEEESDFELAYKRVPVSEAETPNHNPELTGFLVNGVQVAPGGTFIGKLGVEYEIEPLFTEESVEEYQFITSSGEVEIREEEPYFTWFTEDGEFFQEFSLYPYTSVDWSSGGAEENVIKVVMRDRRGGMDFADLNIVIDCTLPGGPADPCNL